VIDYPSSSYCTLKTQPPVPAAAALEAHMGYIRDMINWIVMRIAWLVADIFGWRAALAVFPPFLRVRNHACMNESIMYDEGCVFIFEFM